MLTPAQLTTLHADILADATLAAIQPSYAGIEEIIAAYQLPAAVDFYVWKSASPMGDIEDSIVWASFTPTDAPDTSALWTNRALCCQGKQFNLQTIVLAKDANTNTINTGKANIRQGLKDALQTIPSGVAGANQDAGWNAVKAIITRKTSRLEKLFATGAGTLATPGTLVVEAPLEHEEIRLLVGG